jgi:hypothetical protein
MSEINDGGFAFPRSGSHFTQAGMSLRDWFAGQALAGMLAAESQHLTFKGNWPDAAEQAYQIADAMVDQKGVDEILTEREIE